MARQISRMTITQLRAEIERRHAVLPKLQKKRAKLLKAVGAIDRQIEALGGQAERPARRKGRPAKAVKPRSSGKSLVQSIKDVLGASRAGMRVKDIVTAVQQAGYKSAAKDFYNMVAATVRGDAFKKQGRGVYKLKAGKAAVKKGKKSKKAPKAGAKTAAAPKGSTYTAA